MMAPIGVSLSNIDLDGCRGKKGRLPEKPPSSHCSLVTFLKRSAARLERPKARVNPYDATGYALAARGVDARTLQAFMRALKQVHSCSSDADYSLLFQVVARAL